MKRKKLTPQEKRANIEKNLSGTGLYIYENKTNGHLKLPKRASDGSMVIPPNGRFKGDSYFMMLVRPPQNLLKFIETISEEKVMTEKKLILDQPDMVTAKGTVEHVVDDNTQIQNLRDSVDNKQKPDVLLNEGPIDGVEIIQG